MAGYLDDNDYKQLISSDDLKVVQKADILTRNRAEEAAKEYFRGFLRERYDIDSEFLKTGDDRNKSIVQYLMDETLYVLHSGLPGRLMPEIRVLRKEQLDKWLLNVQKGIISPGIDLIDEEDSGAPIKYGSNSKVSSNW